MKQILRYQNLIIPNKLRIETRLTIDERFKPMYSNITEDGSMNLSLSLFPIIAISLIKVDRDEMGKRIKAPWNPNDSLGLTKYSFPIFVNQLESLLNDLKIPELFVYHGKRLEINEEISNKIRKVFVIGSTTIELSTVVLIQDDDRLEGVKIKFNNEQSTVLLTLNEVESLLYNLKAISPDTICLMLYTHYMKSFDEKMPVQQNHPAVDIKPKE